MQTFHRVHSDGVTIKNFCIGGKYYLNLETLLDMAPLMPL